MTEQTEHWKEKENAQRYAKQTRIGSGIMVAPFAKKIVQSLATLDEAATIVDLGTGPGLLAIELHKLRPHATIIGVDPSEEMLSIARKNAAEAGMLDFEAKLGAAEEIPLAPESADLVVSQSSFHEWEDPYKGLGEIFRILKPGGSLILRDYNGAWLSPWKRKLIGRFHHLEMFQYTLRQVADLLEKTGFLAIEGENRGWQYLVRGVKPWAK
jgi:ubiquinone/menaquinone biosynthesis C-methylase UbiE